jgi:predicted RNase H-like HicB family nuclease
MTAVSHRRIILRPDEDGWWIVEVPSLPGCFTQGKTREEAVENAKEAIASYIKNLEMDGEAIP